MSTKHRITVNLNDEEYQALQRIAEGVDRSLAWLGRRAICDFIEQRKGVEAQLLAELSKINTSQRTAAR